MKPDAALADRRQSVRGAGQEWLRAGWINENVFRSIVKMYPDDRVRVGPVFRILFFVLTLSAILGVIFALYSLINSGKPIAIFALTAGIACWMTANHLIGSQKRVQGGIEAAFSLAAVINLMIGPAILLLDSRLMHDRSAIILLLFFFAILSGVAAWTWGYWPYSALSAGLLFFAVISLPPGRVCWIIIVVVLYRWLIRGCDSMQIPPSLRACSTAFLAVALLAFYAAANICLLDQHVLTGFLFYGPAAEFFPRWLSIGLTAALPCVALFIGIVERRRLFLILGFGFALFSLITLRMYVHVAPLWVVLTGVRDSTAHCCRIAPSVSGFRGKCRTIRHHSSTFDGARGKASWIGNSGKRCHHDTERILWRRKFTIPWRWRPIRRRRSLWEFLRILCALNSTEAIRFH